MEQETNTKQRLATLMAMPGDIQAGDAGMLRELAIKYPYFQPLHLLLAKAVFSGQGTPPELATAAMYNSGLLLHEVLHATGLRPVHFNHVSRQEPGFGASDDPEPLDESVIDEVWESPVSIDFFAFEDNFPVEEIPEAEAPAIKQYQADAGQEAEEQVVSKYDDDRLPYTFLWWLAKTRKEHEQIFQPYASPNKNQVNKASSQAPVPRSELQQQYVENIFHMQSVFGEEDKEFRAGSFRRNSKGDEIIESFIRNEPQISPPKAELINNENKAKKSAEDHSELVSETLAKIYIEQMLYDKAIETYQKLSLMFPEKSRYFADLVQSVEKKI